MEARTEASADEKKRVEWENKIWIFTKIEKEERGRNR